MHILLCLVLKICIYKKKANDLLFAQAISGLNALVTKIPDAVRLSMIHGTKDHQDWDIKEMLEEFQKELYIRKQHVSNFTRKTMEQAML